MDTTETVPLEVQETIAAALQAFLAAAALHLGEPTAEGDRLAEPDPDEAWRALVAASALVRHLEPLVHEDFKSTLGGLAHRLAELHPEREFPVALGGLA